METILISLGTAVGMLFTVYNMFGFRWIAENPNKTDIGCMVITLLFFSSTSTQGIFVSILSGLFISIMTKIISKIWGNSKAAQEAGYQKPETPRQMMENAARTATAMRKINAMIQGPGDGASRH